MENTKITLDLQLLNGILGYLGTRPYNEVFQLVSAIHNEVAPQVQPTVQPTAEDAPPQ
jgi:hypothetical protein